MTLHIIIAREKNEPGRYRVRISLSETGPALLISARKASSVEHAKAEAESLFGRLDWRQIGTLSQHQIPAASRLPLSAIGGALNDGLNRCVAIREI